MTTDVFYGSDEAAKKSTVTGWVSRTGRFYGDDEHMARWDGCTHMRCDCGELYERGRTMCNACGQKLRQAKYEAMPFEEWDGVTPVCLFDDERFFFSEAEAREYCEDHELDPGSLQLVICEPQYAWEVDGDDYFCDLLPQDWKLVDAAPEIADAFDKLNAVIKAHKKPLSWYPGKNRTRLEANAGSEAA